MYASSSESLSFNPRPHAEGDKKQIFGENGGFCFNPRPHAEGDGIVIVLFTLMTGFNPRPHAEGDFIEQRMSDRVDVSIHALTRRATRTCTS